MMTDVDILDLSLKGVQLLATVGLGVGAAWLVVQQRKVAADRLVFDLFDRRMRVYRDLHEVLAEVSQKGGQISDVRLQRRFFNASADARFLFQRPVQEYLDKVAAALAGLNHAHQMTKRVNITNGDLDLAFEGYDLHMAVVEGFFTEFPALIRDYVLFDQKRRA